MATVPQNNDPSVAKGLTVILEGTHWPRVLFVDGLSTSMGQECQVRCVAIYVDKTQIEVN